MVSVKVDNRGESNGPGSASTAARGPSLLWRLHRPCAKRPIRNGWNPRRRSTRPPHRRSTRPPHGIFHGSHLATSLDPRRLDARTAGLERLEATLRFFDFAAALADAGSVVDSSAAYVKPALPIEERYSSRTQPCSVVMGSETRTQLPSRLTTCKFVPGE